MRLHLVSHSGEKTLWENCFGRPCPWLVTVGVCFEYLSLSFSEGLSLVLFLFVCSLPVEIHGSLTCEEWLFRFFYLISLFVILIACPSGSPPPDCLFLTLSVCVDPPSVITEQSAYVRKASSETALSSRAAISAFCVHK